MNDAKVEELLRKSPRPAAPSHLRHQLEATISLPRTTNPSRQEPGAAPLFTRWFPAASFAVFFLVCLAAVGMQTKAVWTLQKENELLRAAAPDLEQLRRENAELKRNQLQSQQLDRLRRDNDELKKLQNEVAQLRAALQQSETVREENQRLKAARVPAVTIRRLSVEEERYGPADRMEQALAQKAAAENAMCINNLKQVGLAAHIWADDQKKEVLPSDMISLRPYLPSTKLLACPVDGAAYQIVSPGASQNDGHVVYAQCPTHGHVVLVDGSAHQIKSSGRKVVLKDGKYVIGE
jgi:TolA-binding protein